MSAEAEARFAFGKNWKRYAELVDEDRVAASVEALESLVGKAAIEGRVFLDIGCGSGLHSLAAHRLGARAVVSFDYDLDSVECTEGIRRWAGAPDSWTVQQGSALDRDFLAGLPRADVVYSWGVLHHTGDMWSAIRNAADLCRGPGDRFVIGIYNRKAILSPLMKAVKFVYVKTGPIGRFLVRWSYFLAGLAYQTLRGRNPLRDLREYGKRGMDPWRDLDDWVGGYPFEYATPAEITAFVEPLGFRTLDVRAQPSFAHVNEFVFERVSR